MLLNYEFGKSHEDFEYEVDDEAVYQYLLNKKYITEKDVEELDYDVFGLFENYRDEIEDLYYDEAKELWEDLQEQEKNPYGYRGVSQKDFY